MKITVRYDHDPAVLSTIDMAVTETDRAPIEGWKPCYRDTVDGKKVIWARFENKGYVWIRDAKGARRAKPV